ncbi:MAG TPA: hypothetical protein DD001_16305 [Microcoleaceae bacterium UBA10368]|nr:hypothetical protein [Microcoleaceae cyanobacterium UBA11344]HBK98764.1 hypothetical protein [Microcoleaceae cyanobacterium UBA10368]HCV28802.1 hypothetical protein [Microcoleaceae cyanobacterium UBA9251]
MCACNPDRFLNRTRRKGWLAPSLKHRVETILTWLTLPGYQARGFLDQSVDLLVDVTTKE